MYIVIYKYTYIYIFKVIFPVESLAYIKSFAEIFNAEVSQMICSIM
jgi:hypothetical protein